MKSTDKIETALSLLAQVNRLLGEVAEESSNLRYIELAGYAKSVRRLYPNVWRELVEIRNKQFEQPLPEVEVSRIILQASRLVEHITELPKRTVVDPTDDAAADLFQYALKTKREYPEHWQYITRIQNKSAPKVLSIAHQEAVIEWASNSNVKVPAGAAPGPDVLPGFTGQTTTEQRLGTTVRVTRYEKEGN